MIILTVCSSAGKDIFLFEPRIPIMLKNRRSSFWKIIAKIIEEEVSFSDFVNLMSFKRGKLAIVRVDLPEDSPVINKSILEISWPENSVLVSILRGEEVIIPRGNTILKSGDDIIALTIIGNEPQLLNLLVGKL